jgi:small nuclear ribonucleoprotein (snRNP)-like protein
MWLMVMVFWGEIGAKAAHKMLVELNEGVQFTNILQGFSAFLNLVLDFVFLGERIFAKNLLLKYW